LDVEARATRLERATHSVDSGDYKKALTELWYAEAEHRGEERELQEALSLATAVADKTKSRVGREAETLVSTLKAGIGHARRLPIAAETKLRPDVPEEQPWRGIWAVSLAAINVLGFLVVLASPDDEITIPLSFLIGFAPVVSWWPRWRDHGDRSCHRQEAQQPPIGHRGTGSGLGSLRRACHLHQPWRIVGARVVCYH
jgi:hypothetical protein